MSEALHAPPVAERESCPLCGGTLKEVVSGCGTCPMNGGCQMVCCENCGYSTVASRSATVNLIKRLATRIRRMHPR